MKANLNSNLKFYQAILDKDFIAGEWEYMTARLLSFFAKKHTGFSIKSMLQSIEKDTQISCFYKENFIYAESVNKIYVFRYKVTER